MSDLVEKIIIRKRKEIEAKRSLESFSALYRRIKDLPYLHHFPFPPPEERGIMAEVKRASPSKGILFPRDGVETLAREYEESGAFAISVVTEDKFFLGSVDDFKKIRECICLPLLRKDFIIDEYQILESKHFGADALLLIASLLSLQELKKFISMAGELGMAAVVEVHTVGELEKALASEAKVIGINNRNLRTFAVDLNTSKKLLPLVPEKKIKIVESGIREEKDLLSFDGFRVNAFLIGEALLTSPQPGEKLRNFCSVLRRK